MYYDFRVDIPKEPDLHEAERSSGDHGQHSELHERAGCDQGTGKDRDDPSGRRKVSPGSCGHGNTENNTESLRNGCRICEGNSE